MIGTTTKRFALIALVLVSAVGSIGTAAAATTTTTTAGNAPLNQTVSVSEDTRALYVSATNATGVLDVTVYSIVNGTETQVANSTLNATANTSDSWEWTLPTDPADEYRVLVDGASVEMVDLAKIEKVAVGGGFMPTDGKVPIKTVTLGGLGLLAVLGTVSYYADDRLL